MFITPSFKKSLIVEQFQGNYLNTMAMQKLLGSIIPLFNSVEDSFFIEANKKLRVNSLYFVGIGIFNGIGEKKFNNKPLT